MAVEIFLSDFQSIANGILRIFSTTNVQFSVELFSVYRLFAFTLLLLCCACMAGNWMRKGITLWESRRDGNDLNLVIGRNVN